MEPNWTQNGIKNRSQLQHANFQKSLKNPRKINTFGVPRGRSWDRKWSQIGPKLGAKIDLNFNMLIFQKSLKNPRKMGKNGQKHKSARGPTPSDPEPSPPQTPPLVHYVHASGIRIQRPARKSASRHPPALLPRATCLSKEREARLAMERC